MKNILFVPVFLLLTVSLAAEDGYRLWLRYHQVANSTLLQQYRSFISSIYIPGNGANSSSTLQAAQQELLTGLTGLLGKKITLQKTAAGATIRIEKNTGQQNNLGTEGYHIKTIKKGKKGAILITANTDIGILYGVFHFLRLVQTNQDITGLNIMEAPKVKLRLLNHWDNLDRYVERGYAGISIWDWHTLPDYTGKRYTDYARANASVGINGTVLTNVNANARVLTAQYLEKVAALANVFRPYGIKVYLTARFSAPIEIGGLKTADPLDENVKAWWKKKTAEIYSLIPDFGGFLVKANSEGQPGPQNYERTHADGANLLADALAPHGGIVMWRAFVYSQQSDDRFKQAYEEFKPLDGKFRENVLIQVKNGPIDFQPREPFSPLFGAMPQTPLMAELQLTQEYLGQGTHLVYEVPMFKECLASDTWVNGKGSYVAKIVDGSLNRHELTGMAGVSNIGNSINWTFHPFGQANWYAFGRLAWDHNLKAEQIAEEWVRQTFSNNKMVVTHCKEIMLQSHEAVVNYMTPLGLHHIMNNGHHYGPAPWANTLPRADWNPVYYHRADSAGIGFDRTATGTNALAQYAPEVQQQYNNVNTCDEKYLLWFHHVSWTHKMRSGRTLWEELCYKYNEGVDSVQSMQKKWQQLKGLIDDERYHRVAMLLSIQEKEARWWRDACLSYFGSFSKMPIPAELDQPEHTLDYYKSLSFPYAPGN